MWEHDTKSLVVVLGRFIVSDAIVPEPGNPQAVSTAFHYPPPHTLTLAFLRDAPEPSCLLAPPGAAAPCRCLGVRGPIPADRALTVSFDRSAEKEYHPPAP